MGRFDEVIDEDNRVLYSGNTKEVKTFLRSLKFPISELQVRVSPESRMATADAYLNGITFQEFMMDVDEAQLVSKWYTMNPLTDELMPNGRLMMPGMMVLVDDQELRQDLYSLEDPSSYSYEGAVYLAKENNRWCTVQEVEILEEDGEISFTALYPDGVKRQRQYSINTGWLVKKDSISEIDSDWVTKTLMETGRRMGLEVDGLEQLIKASFMEDEVAALRERLAQISGKPGQIVEVQGKDSRLIQFEGGSFWYGTSSEKPGEYTEADLVRMDRSTFESLRARDAASRPPGTIVTPEVPEKNT